MARMIAAPPAPSGLVRTNFATSCTTVSRGARGAEAAVWVRIVVAMTSAIADAWIEPRIGQVDEEVHDHETEGNEEDQGLHHRIVPVGDGIHDEPTDPVQGEHRLGDDEPAD